jgi:alpha-tubulin suppressor-like RCC1 family protein
MLSNGGANLSIPASGAFTFGSALASGTPYNVTVSSQPANPAQTCAVTNASGTITGANVSNIAVTCANDDVTSPAVTVTSPLNTAVGAGPLLAITATFSEALNAATVTVSSFMLTGPSGVVSGTVTLTSGNKASFTPAAPLEFNTTYQARLTTAIRDLSNNALAADEVWSFNTGQKLSLGASHACVRYDGGQLKCWGNNSKGELGLGNTNARGDAAGEMGAALPTVNLGTGRVAVEVVAGGEHTCARLDNNQVKCWGSSQYGQLGLGGTANHGDNAGEMGDSLPTVQLGTDDVVLQLAAGRYFTCARLVSGEVKCWGRNDKGQLGVGDTANRGDNSGEMGNALAAIDLGTGRTAIDISATAYHMCARLDNNAAKCWGENDFGQLGLGDTNSRGDAPGEMGDSLPVLNAGAGRTIRQIAVNSGHTCALLDTSGIKCWGHNLYGQLGLGDIEYRGDTPSEVGDGVPTVDFGTGRTATHVVEGSRHTCVLLDTSRVKCWGYNPDGELGLGDMGNRGDAPGEMGDSLPGVDLSL